MNTITAISTENTESTENTDSTSKPSSRRVGRMRSMLAAALVAFVGIGGVSVANAPSASAATATSFCFKWDTGAQYRNQPVYLYKTDRYGNPVSQLRSGKTNSAGCGTFSNTPSNVYLRVVAHVVTGDSNYGMRVYQGWTNYIANPGSGTANLQTATVRFVQCVPGLYTGTC